MLGAYRRLSVAAAPLARRALRRREKRGKEELDRLGERMGRAGLPRPEGGLVWLHGASVGESLSTLPVIERLLAAHPDAHVMVTTGTVTSARMMARRLPARAFHQYVPVDSIRWVRAFLDHWRPDLAIWVESDLWPNLVAETAARQIPMALVNARISRRSYRNWRLMPWIIKPLIGAFGLIAAESEASADRFRRLGGGSVVTTGNIKLAAAPLPVDDMELVAMRSALGGRPIWIAASTHPGEETVIAGAHRLIRRKHPRLLTIVVPRHPERGAALAETLAADDITLRRRSRQEMPETTTGIYIADTLGELGLFYRLGEIVFVGGSLIPHGGQNPIEPALLDSAILHGPNMENFSDVAAALDASGGAQAVRDAQSLADAVIRLLESADARNLAAAAARAVADGERNVIDRLMAQLGPFAAAALAGPATGAHGRAHEDTHRGAAAASPPVNPSENPSASPPAVPTAAPNPAPTTAPAAAPAGPVPRAAPAASPASPPAPSPAPASGPAQASAPAPAATSSPETAEEAPEPATGTGNARA